MSRRKRTVVFVADGGFARIAARYRSVRDCARANNLDVGSVVYRCKGLAETPIEGAGGELDFAYADDPESIQMAIDRLTAWG